MNHFCIHIFRICDSICTTCKTCKLFKICDSRISSQTCQIWNMWGSHILNNWQVLWVAHMLSHWNFKIWLDKYLHTMFIYKMLGWIFFNFPGGWLRSHPTTFSLKSHDQSEYEWGRAPEAPMKVQPKNRGFEASEKAKSLSVNRGFGTIWDQVFVRL